MPRVTHLILAVSLLAATTTVSLSTANRLRDDRPEVHGTNQASTRLMKELVEIYKSESYKNGTIEVELENDNLYEWNVKLFFQDPKSKLYEDLQRMKREGKEDHIMIRISFGDDYPNSPPFVRFLYPVLIPDRRGAFCMHLLSRNGWFSACPTEALILAMMEIMGNFRYRVNISGDSHAERERLYTPEKAREAFDNLVRFDRWDQPRAAQR